MVYLLEHSEELGKLFLAVSSAHPGVVVFGQPLRPNREAGWGFLTEKQVKNRLSNHLGIIVFVTDRRVGTFSERNR